MRPTGSSRRSFPTACSCEAKTLNKDAVIEQRLKRLEARESIRALVTRYCLAMDDRDMAAVPALFTPDARVHSRDGVMDARGIDAILEMYRGRFAVLGPSNHFTHDHLIDFETDAAAHGLVISHAEVVRRGRPMWAALRYHDRYALHDGVWKFSERLLTFFYYLDVADYTRFLGSPDRMRAYETPRPADYPEALETWKQYYK